MAMRDKGLAWIVFLVLVAADAAAWFQVFAAAPPRGASISFLDVGQGDSTLLKLAGGVTIMTDAGPDSSAARSLERVLGQGRRYIDIAVVTHPELDHFNGFNYIVENCGIGAFIMNGRDHPGSRQWAELVAKIAAKNIPLITLGAGDSMRYGPNRIDILSPDARLLGSGELNDAGLVQKVRTPEFTALLTADIGMNVEEHLRTRYDLSADILKVGHHGSKYSSGAPFSAAVRPALAVVSVGARNTYGHPTTEALARLAAVGAKILRTDQRGAMTARRVDGELKIYSEK